LFDTAVLVRILFKISAPGKSSVVFITARC